MLANFKLIDQATLYILRQLPTIVDFLILFLIQRHYYKWGFGVLGFWGFGMLLR